MVFVQPVLFIYENHELDVVDYIYNVTILMVDYLSAGPNISKDVLYLSRYISYQFSLYGTTFPCEVA